MKTIFFIATAGLLLGCNNQQQQNKSVSAVNNFSTEGKKVVIYTTADSTNNRLTATDTLSFV